ncbi:MAG: choice-of-anchor L domain-containing protein, partial [bacterium]
MTGGGVIPAGVTAITSTVDGSQQGMGTYNGFPTLPIGATPGDGIILSCGNVADAATTNSSPGKSATLNTPGDPQLDALIGGITHDATSLTLTFTTDASVTGVSFNFLFASEEFPEFVGSVYNDAFAAILDGQNISFDSNGNYISVNNNFFQLDNDPWDPSNPAKIGKAPVSLAVEYDGLTPLLLTSKSPLAPGTHTLKFVIADAGDSVLDSAVFISNFKFSAQGDSGTSVAPGGNTVVIGPEPTNTADIVSWYGFDDGGQTAEDSMHQLNWNYALQGIGSGMVTNKYVERIALPDADANGLPDWWESLVYGNLTNAVGPATDTDGDGLTDVFEYKCDTNPKNVDTDNDGIWDGNEDADNDGLTNLMEQNLGSDPRLLDTDDDGIGDFAEAVAGSSLIDSTSPLNQKAIYLDGPPGTYVELPPDVRFKLTTWAAQMYIKPMAIGPATMLSRTVQTGVTNYFMALDSSNHVVAGFTAADHSTNISLRSTVPVPTNVWTFVGAGYNDRTGAFEISLNATVNTNMISMKIPAANGVYPENIRVGEGFVGLVDDLRIWYGLPGILDPGLLDGKETGLLAYYRFDDGTSWVNGVDGGGGVSLRADWKTGQVEDMTQKLGWKDGWRNAATLRGAAVFTNLTDATSPFADLDSDGDGLPDWWEIKYGLDPRSAVGINGTWGDPDLDGLNNFDEFRDGVTDPKKFYSLGSSFGDFDSRSSATNLSLTNRPFGSIFNDGDGMLDSWESQYPDLSPLLYDANTDPDGDGWSNYGESRGGSNPESAASYPKPSITFNFTYDGVLATGPIIVNAYNSSGMDGVPNAGLTVPNQVMPFSTTVVAFTRGYLREGKNWFFAFADNNANGAWDTGEPAGIAEGQPFTVGWDVVPPVSIKLTDAAPSGYARFSWPSIAGASSYSVTVRRTTTTGGPIVFTKVINAPRTYIHEGDFQNAGIFGLDDGNSQAPGFQWIVGAVDGTFGMNWATTQSVPTAVWPAGADLAMARNKFQWRMDSSATMFQMQFSTNPAFSVLALDLTTNVPIRRADGISAYVPFDGNSGQLKNGLSYFWRLRSINPYCTSSWMATNSFHLNLQPSGVGASSISGDTFYFGKVTNSSTYKQRIVVEAFTSQGFSGVPSAMTVMTNTGPFTLMGLAPGSYTVRAFFDQNTNNVLDDWESWGFVKETGIAANDYPPKLLTIPINIGGQKLVIRDRDTDNDKLPDAWEFAHFGNLTAAGPGTLYQSPGYTDTDGDGLSDLHEFELGTDPQKTDSDADGMTDGQEASMPGMNPLDPDDDGDGIPTSSEVLWSGAAGYQAGLDLNPSLTDSDGDGVGDLMEIAAGSDPLIASSKATVALSKFTASGSNLPILKWNMHSNTRSMKVRYHLMRSPDLITWTEVGTTLSDGTKNIESSITDLNATDRVYYY